MNSASPNAQPEFYTVRVKGHLAPGWSEWLEGMAITHTESGETVLSGPLADQAALHGLLAKIRDLNLVIVSVIRVEAGPPIAEYQGKGKSPFERERRSQVTGHSRFTFKSLMVPAIVMLAFWGVALLGWSQSGSLRPLFMFGYIGTALGVGLGLYGVLPKLKKPLGRRLTLFLVGAFLIIFAVFIGQENTQIEGLLFGLLAGVVQMAVIHYLIAKIFGPLLFGRLWCGWACWTVMILDLLPFKRPSGRLPGRWGWLRYLHLALSVTLVGLLWFGLGFREGALGQTAVLWFIAGNVLYYAAGITLAFALRDNRAFCKYLCPVSVPLKITTRFSLLKIGATGKECNDCGACVKMCPMDVRIPDYILNGQRVLSTECSLCQTCITVCAKDSLKLSFGFDLGGKDLLRVREPASARGTAVAPAGD